MRSHSSGVWTLCALACLLLAIGCSADTTLPPDDVALSDQQIDHLVRLSYPYVALYNVNNKFAIKQGGWNTVEADTELKDHTMREIARPNNDTLYVSAMFDLRDDAAVLEMPAFGSDYASLMITAYDHYVNVPMTTRLGDFEQPEKMLIYSARTRGYAGEPVDGIDRYFEASGDFVSAVFRVMPHASDPERFAAVTGRMQEVRLMPLSEFLGNEPAPRTEVVFPAVGARDADIFESNLLEVMQFVFNHTTFDPANEIDQELLAAYEPLGVVPGAEFDPAQVATLDGMRLREAAERIWAEEMAKVSDPETAARYELVMFQPKGQISQETLLFQSILGPIGLPAAEAVYPAVIAADGAPMNALNDYVIRMSADELPPHGAFWSVTLYDTANGFFIPNERKKYSVGANAGMQLDDNGGIAIYIAAEQPPGVPDANWLPIERADLEIGPILRIYAPDFDRLAEWKTPVAERLDGTAG